MHGLLSATTAGTSSTTTATRGLAARFDFGAHDALMAAFPFAHELLFEATLTGPR